MAGEILAGIGAFKTMIEIVKSISGMSETAAVNSAVIDLQSNILDAQAAYQEQAEEIQSLKAEIARYDIWETERARYRMEDLPPGVMFYALIPEHADGEPQHYICPNCFGSKKKSLLQKTRVVAGTTYWRCSSCEFTARTGHSLPIQQSRVIR